MKNYILVPLSIVIAGGIIAVAVYFVNKNPGVVVNPDGTITADVKPVDSSDHILGNPDAPIKLIEYSDFECPHCKTYQSTLKQIMEAYGGNGQVAWVFRHFPIYEIHTKAPKEAEAAECAAEVGGNDGFWKFADRLFEVTPSNDGLDLASLPEIAASVGLDREKFKACLDSGKYAAKVQSQRQEAIKVGAQGTPFILISVRGTYLPLPGSQPVGAIRSAIDEILKQIGTSTPSN